MHCPPSVGWMTPFSSTGFFCGAGGGWVKRHPPYAKEQPVRNDGGADLQSGRNDTVPKLT